ncbi:MAG: hypothetical protein L0Y66_23395 [Myxococcaceae bacterium]|nr:hypothetical protein [Myxococcaceae bacterium]MCI0672190.1 hypothetical protein [Myxococcaceae bacterium]
MRPQPLPTPSPELDASRRRSARMAAVAMLLMAAPFFFLGIWMLDRPALTELVCAPGGAHCTLARAGWLTRTEAADFEPAALTTARVDRRDRRRGPGNSFRPVVEVGGRKEPLTFRWEDTPDAAEALVTRLHAHARAPREPLVFRDEARRGTLGPASTFLVAGCGVLFLAGFLARRGWRRMVTLPTTALQQHG